MEAAAAIKELKLTFNALLTSVKSGELQPGAALSSAVLAVTNGIADLMLEAVEASTTARDNAVQQALAGAGEGQVLLGADFQSGGQGTWDDHIARADGLLDRADDKVERALWQFVKKLEATAAKQGLDVDIHLQYREHDPRLWAVQCPASVVANAPPEALETPRTSQILIEARFVETTNDFTSELGVLAPGEDMLGLNVVTRSGDMGVDDLLVSANGALATSLTIGDPADGGFRIDLLDPETDMAVDQVGGRAPSTSEPAKNNEIRKQYRKTGNSDFRFFRQISGQQLKFLRLESNMLRKDHKQGIVSTADALRESFDLFGNAMSGINFWRNIALRNPGSFATSQLRGASVPDEDIDDEYAADGGGFATRYGDRMERVSIRRGMTGARLLKKNVAQLVGTAQKRGESVEANLRTGPNVSVQGPTVTSFQDPVLQLTVRPHITTGGAIRLEISPEVSDDFAILQAQAAPGQSTIDLSAVKLLDGETVVLGGLLVDSSQRVEAEVPLLSDIPLLGYMFQASNPGTTRRNLIVMVTPTILDTN